MKNVALIFILACCSFTLPRNLPEVALAFREGNAAALAVHFDTYVDISLPNRSNAYSARQAERVLADFFVLHPVKRFEWVHQGGNAGAVFGIGTLTTQNGIFRVTLYLRNKNGAQKLQEIRLESRP